MSYSSPLQKETIPHYHGDTVRTLFLVTVALSFLAIPFWGHLIPYGTLFEVVSGIVLIALAGLTSPHSKSVMVLNVIASAIGAFLLELSAIALRSSESIELLIMREIGALVLIGALYFSIKTFRAMAQGKIGELPRPWEFEKTADGDSAKNI